MGTNEPDNNRLLKACRREPVDRIPIWLMRQAGRYMAEYRALRKDYGILELIRNPELAAEVTLQPVNAFDLDAAIIFADILTILDEMGLGLEFVKGEGPFFHRPIRKAEDVDQLVVRPAEEALGYTIEAVRVAVKALDRRIPLIGFSGAPFTLACYAIEGRGSRDFAVAKQFMYAQPQAWHKLMEVLADAVAEYLCAQVAAGADVVQLFDSWAGALGPADYREFVQPHSAAVISRVKEQTDVPVIHFGTDSAGILEHIRNAGGDVIGVDWRIDLEVAMRLLGPGVAVQGNLDPLKLLGPPEHFQPAAEALLRQAAGRPGYIFNLGHGIHKTTPPDHVRALVETVHAFPVHHA